jgi:hypothetical protein
MIFEEYFTKRHRGNTEQNQIEELAGSKNDDGSEYPTTIA